MKVRIDSTNTVLTGINGDVVQFNGVLPIWPLIRQRIRITEIDGITDIILYAEYADGDVLFAELKADLIAPVELDLSVFSALFDSFDNKLIDSIIFISGFGPSVDFSFSIPVINLYVPTLSQKVSKWCTDFRDDLGPRDPVAHGIEDRFFIDSRLSDDVLDMSFTQRNGSGLLLSRQQGEIIDDVQEYAELEINHPTTGGLIARKKYPALVDNACALTFTWLNSTGSMDYISCFDWLAQPTLLQGLDGGKVTKNELTCVFPVTPANQYALARLAVSPMVSVQGLRSDVVNLRCSSTAGAKVQASGLVKTLTLKFVY